MVKLYRIDIRKRITLSEDALKEINAEPGDYISFEIENGDVILKKRVIS